jgi:hypothetical protein
VLELFTSQGCSSCPRAEELLSRLGFAPETKGVVIPLAFHVDYWNQLGWTDPFSQRAWSLRQEAYARALGVEDGLYTPQLVVNGAAQLNGSDGRRALEAIDAALRRPAAARIELDARFEPSKRALALAVAAEVLTDVPPRKLELLVALFEGGLHTSVRRGENGGRTLRNDFIVRHLRTAFSMPGQAGRQERELTIKLDRDWRRENLGVTAFLQDARSMRILGAVARQPQ